jgi:hypothetical protein
MDYHFKQIPEDISEDIKKHNEDYGSTIKGVMTVALRQYFYLLEHYGSNVATILDELYIDHQERKTLTNKMLEELSKQNGKLDD